MRVYLIQCLCPNRHAIMGIAYEAGGPSRREARGVQGRGRPIDRGKDHGPLVGVAIARWHYGPGARYRSLAEAEIPLRANEAAQAATGGFLEKGSRN